MNRLNIKKSFVVFLLSAGVMLTLPLFFRPIVANADTSEINSDYKTSRPVLEFVIADDDTSGQWSAIKTTIDEINNELKADKLWVVGTPPAVDDYLLTYANTDHAVYFYKVLYANNTIFPTNVKQKIIQVCTDKIQNTDNTNNVNLSTTNKNRLYNFIRQNDPTTTDLVRQLDSDVNTDFYTAYHKLRPVFKIVSLVLGILSLAIVVTLGFALVLDLAYIVIPTFQVLLDEKGAKGSGQKPPLISIEAYDAVRQAEASVGSREGYQQPISIWASHKVKQMIIMGICLIYLVSGRLFVLIGGISDMFVGFLPQ